MPVKRPTRSLPLRAGDAVVTGLVRAVFGLVSRMPRSRALALAQGLGNLAFRYSRMQRKVALANLELVYGETLPADRRASVARESFQSFSRAMVDFAWFSREPKGRLREDFRFESSLEEACQVAPAIIVTAHFGNWELLGQAGAFRGGAPVVSVAAMFPNESLNRFITSQREKSGMTITPRAGALRALLKTLKEGGRVALVMDQNTRISEGGVFVTFFGRPVAMSPAAGVLAVRTGAPVIPAFCRAMPDGTYVGYAGGRIKPGPGGEAEVNQRIASAFEEEVRRHPGQWLWMYRRWKYIPPGGDPAAFPFYAHPAT